MDINEIKKLLIDSLVLKIVYVNRDDNNHYQIIAVDDCFLNMSAVQRQKMIYIPLMDCIANGIIHSVSIQAFTFKEWERECALIIK